MSNIDKIIKISFATKDEIIEIESKAGRFTTEDGRVGYGTLDVTDDLSFDELKSLADFLNHRASER